MSASPLLRLKYLMNHADEIPAGVRALPLDQGQPPGLLVLDEALARRMLTSEFCSPYPVLNLWSLSTRRSAADCPWTWRYFEIVPLQLHGDAHFQTRRALLGLYRKFSESVEGWIGTFVSDFLASRQDGLQDPLAFCDDLLSGFYQRWICGATGLDPADWPALPEFGFRLFIKPEHLDRLEQFLARLAPQLATASGITSDEALLLLSVVVMGRDALRSVLVDLLTGPTEQLPPGTQGAELVSYRSAAVNILGRQCLRDHELEGYPLQAGQFLVVVPHLIHARRQALDCPMSESRLQSFAFGYGPHLCPGRAVSLLLLKTFLADWPAHQHRFSFSPVEMVRDLTTICLPR